MARRSSQNTTFQNLDLAPSDPKGLLKLSSFLWTLGFGLPRGITNLRVSIDDFGHIAAFLSKVVQDRFDIIFRPKVFRAEDIRAPTLKWLYPEQKVDITSKISSLTGRRAAQRLKSGRAR